jgi:hypothetical protein
MKPTKRNLKKLINSPSDIKLIRGFFHGKDLTNLSLKELFLHWEGNKTINLNSVWLNSEDEYFQFLLNCDRYERDFEFIRLVTETHKKMDKSWYRVDYRY